MTKIIELTNNRDFDKWMEYCGKSMQHLHFLILTVVNTVLVNVSKSSVSFLNVNIMSNKLPVATLDMSYFKRALTAVHALAQQFTNAQALMIPLIVHAESIYVFLPASPTTTSGRNRTITPGNATPKAATPLKKGNIQTQ